MCKQIIIMRGLPGAGKSSWIKEHYPQAVICSADLFWGPNYDFDIRRIGEAHAFCLQQCLEGLKTNTTIVIDNTNSRIWQYQNYVTLAQLFNYKTRIVELGTCNPNLWGYWKQGIHKVPISVIMNMWETWEVDPLAEKIPAHPAPEVKRKLIIKVEEHEYTYRNHVYEVPENYQRKENVRFCGIHKAYKQGTSWYYPNHEVIYDSELIYQYELI